MCAAARARRAAVGSAGVLRPRAQRAGCWARSSCFSPSRRGSPSCSGCRRVPADDGRARARRTLATEKTFWLRRGVDRHAPIVSKGDNSWLRPRHSPRHRQARHSHAGARRRRHDVHGRRREHPSRHSKPIGSLTQMATIRLGKRTDNRSPLIKDFVPLAALDDIVFGAWDPIPDDAYTAAKKAGVLEDKRSRAGRRFPRAPSSRCRRCSTTSTSRASTATNVKKGKTKRDLAEQLRQDMRDFKAKNKCDRLVIVWCASTEIFIKPGPQHATIAAVREGDGEERRDDLARDAVRVGGDHGRRPVLQRRAEPRRRHAGAAAARQRARAFRSRARISRPARRG